MKKTLSGLLAALAGGIVELGSARHPAGITLAVEKRREAATEAPCTQRPVADGGRLAETRNLRATYRVGLTPSEE